ncbi:hypothetical protein ACFQT4_23450 [Pseudoduganella danionis]|uniref:hypothetical protein n=1 Tax=Pseudoduganella danionis TaxID=1890295 RepID=UPI0036222575
MIGSAAEKAAGAGGALPSPARVLCNIFDFACHIGNFNSLPVRRKQSIQTVFCLLVWLAGMRRHDNRTRADVISAGMRWPRHRIRVDHPFADCHCRWHSSYGECSWQYQPEKYCVGTYKALARLRLKYAKDASIISRLRDFEDEIEPHPEKVNPN